MVLKVMTIISVIQASVTVSSIHLGQLFEVHMSNDRLIIPNKIMVGYQARKDTYTGQLAYVIYYDQKGVLRKEKSWKGWRDKSFTPNHYENVPTEGFVLNKKVGGVRESYGWNTRQEYVRVYDPRGFEFEISIPNLLFILKECDCSRGKGLEGKFVYAWDGTSLVLLPVASQEYVESSSFTELQVGKVSARDLIVGATYLTKKKQRFTYLGRLDYFFMVDVVKDLSKAGSVVSSGVEKRHVFWDGKRFEPLKGLTSIAQVVTDSVSPDFADLVSAYGSGAHGSRVVSLSLEPCVVENCAWYYIAPDGSFVSCYNQLQ